MSTEEKRNDLLKIRNEVDLIDRKLVELLESRSGKSLLIGKLKKELGLELHSPEREGEIFRNILNMKKDILSDQFIRKIFTLVLEESLSLQKKAAGESNA
jgi:chorismate mutase